VAARFDAFISYSRRASGALAVELRNGVERFAKPWNKLRASRVFLDDASMSANTGLWSNIEKGLTEAEWFILLASPASAASDYVTAEINWWREHKPADRILLVLDEGEILWDPAAGDFDWARSTAVNPALTQAFAEEPRWVDLSWFEQPQSLGTSDPRFTERVADVAAAVRFQERDELIGENVRERRRALNLLRGGVIALAGLLVASLVATVIAVVNGNVATEQARIAQARQLAAQAITLSTTDLRLASLLAVEAVRLHDDVQTRAALFQLQNASPYLVRSLPVGSEVRSTAMGADGSVVTGGQDGVVSLWDGGERRDLLDLPDYPAAVAQSAAHDVVAAVTADPEAALAVWTEDGIQQFALSETGSPDATPPVYVSISLDGRYLAISSPSTWTTLFEAGPSGSVYQPIGTVDIGGRVGFGDGELTVFSAAGWARVALADAAVIDRGQHAIPMGSAFLTAVSADGRVMASAPDRGINYSLWYTVGSVSGGGTVEGDPADLIATSAIGGPSDMTLNEDGTRFAAMTEGAIYVSKSRDPSVLPEPPIVLDGAGHVGFGTLAFAGEHLVSGSGDTALVWDLSRVGRATTEFPAPVPEGCNACGPQIARLNDAGTLLVMTDVSGFSTVVTDLATGTSITVDSDGDDDDLDVTGANWFGDDRIIAYSPGGGAGAGELLVLGGPQYRTVAARIPVDVPQDAKALELRSDGIGIGSVTGSVTLLDDAGRLQTIEVPSGAVMASSDAFVPLFTGQAPAGFDIAADQSTAYVWFYGGALSYLDLSAGRVVYETENVDGAAFDGDDVLHVFSGGEEWTVDRGSGDASVSRTAQVENVPAPVVSPDGRIVVWGGSTGTMSLTDMAERGVVLGRVPVPVQDGKHPVSVFSRDGGRLITTIPALPSIERPGSVRIMDLTVPGWISASCAVAGRDLDPSEWRNYLGTEPPDDLRCDR
jgi:hypothetical protein